MHLNEVVLWWARLVHGWVSISGSIPSVGNLSRTNQPPSQLSLAIPLWVDAMSTKQRAVMLCGSAVKAGMARVWWQVKLCESLYNTCHI